jgi:TetR/AcrR family transcriptional regulator
LTQTATSSRDKILDVAEALFARRGYAGVGLREVADAAGLGKSSLFHHFSSKALLYSEVMWRVLARLQERLDAALHFPASAERRLERWVEVLIDSLAEHPTTARLLLRGLFEDDGLPRDAPEAQAAEETLASILDGIQELLREGVEDGAFRRVSVPHTVQTLIGASVYHFASADVGERILGRPLFSAEAVARRKEEVIALLRHGLGPDPRLADPSNREPGDES